MSLQYSSNRKKEDCYKKRHVTGKTRPQRSFDYCHVLVGTHNVKRD